MSDKNVFERSFQVTAPDGREVTVMVTNSAGSDNAIVVFIDTDFEPNGDDGKGGLRINVNDSTVGSCCEDLNETINERHFMPYGNEED